MNVGDELRKLVEVKCGREALRIHRVEVKSCVACEALLLHDYVPL